MSTRMLIDARHPEETRVTVVKGSRVEEFDYESATKRPLKGNIYLARVTRVEPSLQAAFVEYGGNRHGFLAFSEIHPDYYQIPVEDRRELIEAETKAALERSQEIDAKIEQEAEEVEKQKKSRRGRRSKKTEEQNNAAEEKKAEDTADSDASVKDDKNTDEVASTDEKTDPKKTDSGQESVNTEESDGAISKADATEATEANDEDASQNSDEAETDEEIAEAAARRHALRALKRRYSIQEVIKRRQVLLVQVVKEERGNKGAALTTYMSLAGRYCVLMPNSTHSGGISRKISNASDRRSLKKIISSLEIPDEMGLIVRTAGMERTKTEIKRDFDYLVRLWSGIRELTLKSVAPSLVYEEGNLIKRTIRDLYTRDIDEIQVEGEQGYKSAKEFMKMLMPSHAKKVQHYTDPIPLFHRYQVENHLEAMYQPVVQLRSGGYIVINPTEALISIDVNSGRATKEHNIEETAVKTNLEAAEEVARQLRLRDLAGLVVIDFIDMEERSNNRAVERRMKDVLKSDRARIQVGRISSFGLMEMSRQRLRSNLQEMSMETCPTCAGTGIVRSVESAALMALRQLEEEGIRGRSSIVRVAACPEVAVYLLNKKRQILTGYENKYGIEIEILAQPSMGPSDLELTYEAGSGKPTQIANVVTPDTQANDMPAPAVETHSPMSSDDEKTPRTRRRRRRRRRGGDDNRDSTDAVTGAETQNTGDDGNQENTDAAVADEDKQERKPRRRRGSRGGRRRPDRNRGSSEQNTEGADALTDQQPETTKNSETLENDDGAEQPRTRRRRVRKSDSNKATDTAAADASTDATAEPDANKQSDKPRRGRRKKTEATKTETVVEDTGKSADASDGAKPRRRGRKPVEGTEASADDNADKKPRTRRKKKEDAPFAIKSAATDQPASKPDEKPEKKPTRGRPRKTAAKADKVDESSADPAPTSAPEKKTTPKPSAETAGGGDDQPKRKGWWQRNFG